MVEDGVDAGKGPRGGVVDRHDALRMTFTPAGNELCVTDSNTFALERMDLSDRTGAEQEAAIKKLWQELAGSPMDLFEGPLFRAIWLELCDEQHELILLAHHVICDGWSFYVILDELGKVLSGDAGTLSDAPSFAADKRTCRNGPCALRTPA